MFLLLHKAPSFHNVALKAFFQAQVAVLYGSEMQALQGIPLKTVSMVETEKEQEQPQVLGIEAIESLWNSSNSKMTVVVHWRTPFTNFRRITMSTQRWISKLLTIGNLKQLEATHRCPLRIITTLEIKHLKLRDKSALFSQVPHQLQTPQPPSK